MPIFELPVFAPRRWGTWLLAAILLMGVPAMAKPPETPAQAAARLTRLGIQLQDEGRHLEAIRIFDDALQRVPHVKIRYYKMRSYHALGRAADAQAILVDIIDDPALQDRRAELNELRTTLKQALQPVSVRVVTPAVSGATVTLDTKRMGRTPLDLQVVPGGHTLKLERDGYKTHEQALTVTPGQAQQVLEITLSKVEVVPEATPEPEPKPAPNTWLPWTLIGVGGAAVLGSSGFWAKHVSDAAEVDKLGPGYSQSSINLILGGVTAGLGAGLIVTGIVLFDDDESDAQPAAPAVSTIGTTPLPGGGAVFVGGRF